MKKLSSLKRILRGFVYVFVCMLGIQAMAQESDIAAKNEQMDKLFEGTVHAPAPGASVLVIHQGKIVHKEGYGLDLMGLGVRIIPADKME
jgi:CubicO group peptidase (beta-lactamase class C family)